MPRSHTLVVICISRGNKPIQPHLRILVYSSLAMTHDVKCSLLMSLSCCSLCEEYYKYNSLIIVTYLRYSQDILYFCKKKGTGLYLQLGAADNETPDNWFSVDYPSAYIKNKKTWAQPWSCSEAIGQHSHGMQRDAPTLTFSILSFTALMKSHIPTGRKRGKAKAYCKAKWGTGCGQTHGGSERKQGANVE